MVTEPTTNTEPEADAAAPRTEEGRAAVGIGPALATDLVLFDGVCGLCNRWVAFLLKHDRHARFRFATIQGETGTRLLPGESADPSSVVLVDRDGTWRHSTAIVRMLRGLGGAWSLWGTLLRLVPRPVRDAGYRFVARHRYRWFGRKETCRLPTPEERARFLP